LAHDAGLDVFEVLLGGVEQIVARALFGESGILADDEAPWRTSHTTAAMRWLV
jgi:hypothetical protein